GGVGYLATLDLDLPDVGRLTEYADIVKDRSVRRDLIGEAESAIRKALGTARPVGELLADHRDSTDKFLGRAARVRWESAGPVLPRLPAPREASPKALSGLPPGSPGWDSLGPGFPRGGLYVVAGRPGMGKPPLPLALPRHVAVVLQQPVGVFSLEMR